MCIILSFDIWSSACLETNLNWTPMIKFQIFSKSFALLFIIIITITLTILNYLQYTKHFHKHLFNTILFSVFNFFLCGRHCYFSEEQTEDQRDLKTYWKSHSKYQKQYSNKDIPNSKVCSLLTVLSYWCVHGSVFWGVLEILKLGTWVPEAPGWEEHWQKWVIKDSINPGWTNKK